MRKPGAMQEIQPDDIRIEHPGYTPGHWDYPLRCADLDLAMRSTRQRIEEWDAEGDPHGFWHERPLLIAMFNALVSHQGGTNHLAASSD